MTPSRRFVSSSSGITGSLFVFPNRSETQKDNIDSRLDLAPMVAPGSEFSGTPIRPYDANSLEQRRIEIYEGNFSKLTAGAFVDALQYEYKYTNSQDASKDGTYTGELLNDDIADGTISPSTSNPPTTKAVRVSDGKIFEYTSNYDWRSPDGRELYNQLPTSDRDKSSLNYEVPLAILLDGANEWTKEHAWRSEAMWKGDLADKYDLYQNDPTNPDYASYAAYSSYYSQGWNSGNSSFTGTGNAAKYQFTGLSVFYDETDTPYEGPPINSKAELNVWPPEIAKYSIPINTNWVMKGYSDLSMHPRNKTKKNVRRHRAGYDQFSTGSRGQRSFFNRVDNLDVEDSGWWVENQHSWIPSKYTNTSGTQKDVAIGYKNTSNRYTVGWNTNDTVMFEFWVKPCVEQTSPGTICHLTKNYGIVLLPNPASLANGKYSNFKIAIYVQNAAANNATLANSDSTTNGASNAGIYVTDAVLNLDQWHHVAIRWSEKFNNGLLSVYVDSVLETTKTEDGVYAGSRTGLVNTGASITAGGTLFLGGWCQSGGIGDPSNYLWRQYAKEQEVEDTSVSTNYSYTTGEGFDVRYPLRSEIAEFRIWNVAKTEMELLQYKKTGLTSTANMRCYIPFMFDPRTDTPQWNRYYWLPNTSAKSKEDYYLRGYAMTEINKSTLSFNKAPFCTNSAYIVGMPFINVHSYLRDYAQSSYPVVTGIEQVRTTSSYPKINDKTLVSHKLEYIKENWESLPWLRAINSMILPCDNKSFESRMELHNSGSHFFLDPQYIRLEGNGIADVTSSREIKYFMDDEVYAIQEYAIENDPALAGFKFTGAQNFRDTTQNLYDNGKLGDADFLSPLSTVIDIPQIYYGNRINPESIVLKFTLSETGKVITIKDKDGTLYRMDSTDFVHRAKVGHVDYGNGILCIFSPYLTSLGIDDFDISFKGEKNLHVMQLDIPCPTGTANVSAHPGFKSLKASPNANESDGNVTYISQIYLHDSNLNIVGKVNLAQPVQKREEDSFIFRVKVDF